MRKRFLEENHRGVYSYMLLSETLWKHLTGVDEECNEMMDRLVRQMAKSEGVTEQLKSDDWLLWFQKMSRHRLCLVCGGLDILCVSSYGVVKGEQSSPIALGMPTMSCEKIKIRD